MPSGGYSGPWNLADTVEEVMALVGLVEVSMLKEVLIQMMFKQRESIVPAWP